MKRLLVTLFILVSCANTGITAHIRSDGNGGFWQDGQHIRSDSNDGFWKDGQHIRSDGNDGFWIP